MNSSKIKTISLGKPILTPYLIPVEHKATPNCINAPFMINGERYKVTAMALGSPHGAVFTDCIDSVDVQKTGTALGTHPLFPKGADIVFIQVLDGETLKTRIWLREKGETDFSAEAVCVACVTSMMLHRVITDKVKVLAGDDKFIVEWDRATGNVFLTGEAELLENTNSYASGNNMGVRGTSSVVVRYFPRISKVSPLGS